MSRAEFTGGGNSGNNNTATTANEPNSKQKAAATVQQLPLSKPTIINNRTDSYRKVLNMKDTETPNTSSMTSNNNNNVQNMATKTENKGDYIVTHL